MFVKIQALHLCFIYIIAFKGHVNFIDCGYDYDEGPIIANFHAGVSLCQIVC